jgi:hypothetical protein
MRKAYTLLVLGVWLAILPYLGFPYSWKDIMTTLSGLSIIYFSYTLYKSNRPKKAENEQPIFENFSENKFEGEKEL